MKEQDEGALISQLRAELERATQDCKEFMQEVTELKNENRTHRLTHAQMIGADKAQREILSLLIDRLGDR